MAAISLADGRTLVVRRQSIACAADLARPGRARLMHDGHTVATGVEALRAAYPFCSPEARAASQGATADLNAWWTTPANESVASLAQIADTQPSILKRLAFASLDKRTSINSLLADRSAGDEIGWRSTAEQLRDAGFISFSLNRPSIASPDGEDRAAFIPEQTDKAAPVAGSASTPTDWGREAVERRWRANGPCYSVKPLRSGKISTIVKRFGPVSTVAWADAAGKTRTIEHLAPTQYAQMLEAISKQGGTVVSVTESNRWYTEPASPGQAQYGLKLWRQRFGSADPLELAFAKRRRPGPRVETPYFLRHDLIADRAGLLTQDLRGREDEDDADSPSVLEFGAALAEHGGKPLRGQFDYATRASNTQAFIDWLADHEYRLIPIVAAIYRACGEDSPEVRKLIAARLARG